MKRNYQKHQELQAGQQFGYWTIIKLSHFIQDYKKDGTKNGRRYYYLCRCKCGTEKTVAELSLKNGSSKSCGCYFYTNEVKQKISEGQKTHGYSKTRLYKIWIGIKTRCYGNPNRYGYNDYGGRGIKMCSEWKNNFLPFREWALNNGYDETAKKGKCTIDRIDVNGDYSPENCRFISIKEQMNNRRKTTFITYKGQTKPMSEWCKEYGIKINTAHKRIKMGWDLDKVFNEPINQKYIRNGKRNKKGGK